MPRTARIKSPCGIYHIMVRGNSDMPLFKDSSDKDKYLALISKYLQRLHFKVYAYCLMTTHGHILIDCCGADISKIMKSINQSYAAYYNKRNNRRGHVFQDRFKSKIVGDERYLINLSAYIHNNPKDIEEFAHSVEKYTYSSLGVYLGMREDTFEILDTSYVLSHFSNNVNKARKTYFEHMSRVFDSLETVDIEFQNEHSEYRCDRNILIRNFSPDNIIKFILNYTGNPGNIHIKYNHKNTEFRALCVLIMRSLCNYTLKEICAYIGNISSSGVLSLCEKGFTLISTEMKYKSLIHDLIREFPS